MRRFRCSRDQLVQTVRNTQHYKTDLLQLMNWECYTFVGAIQRHFSFLKGSGISADEMNCIALDTTAFNQTEFGMIQNQRNGILKIDAFLKKLIRKGNHQCTLFLEGLRQTRHAEIVHVITETENSGKFNKAKIFCQPCTGSHGKQIAIQD